jgi:hypothetical protein
LLGDVDPEDLAYFEKYFIKKLNTVVPSGYNLTEGGEGTHGLKYSDETKNKLREIAKNRSPEVRKRMSEAQLGKKKSQETIEKLRVGSTGKRHSAESKKKMSEKLKEAWKKRRLVTVSEETRKRCSEGQKRRIARQGGPSNLGKPHTEKTKQKMREAHKRRFSVPETSSEGTANGD